MSRSNRRNFLKKSALFAAASMTPNIVRASALGRDDKAAASERIGLGFIGCGGRSGQISPGFLRQDTQAIATCDVWSSRAQAAKERLKAEHAYGDFRELLARADIDAVVIATPEHWHVPIAVAAAKAGKDMYCEKSLGTTVAEGRILCDTIGRYGQIFQFGTQQRSDRRFRHACELVRNGRIGQLKKISVSVPSHKGYRPYGDPIKPPGPAPKGFDYEMWLGPAPWIPYVGQDVGRWAKMPDYAVGFLTTWGVHHADIAQWANGSDHSGPIAIEGQASYGEHPLCRSAFEWHAKCTYAGGVELHHFNNAHPDNPTTGHEAVLLEGTEGTIQVSRRSLRTTPKSLAAAVIGEEEIKLYRSDNHAHNFLDCAKSREETVSPVEVAHRSTTISLLCDIAMRLESKLTWDPIAEKFPGNDEANRLLCRSMRAPWQI